MRIPKYRRRKDRNTAFLEHEGHRIGLGKWESPESRERYNDFIRRLLEQNGKPLPTSAQPTINQLVDAYLTHARGYYLKNGQPSSEYHGVGAAAAPLVRLFGELPVDRFGPRALEAVRAAGVEGSYIRPGERFRSWSRRYANHQTNRLRRIFRWGVAQELVPPSVLEALRAVSPLRAGRTDAVERPPVEPVDPAHVRAILPCLGPVVRAMVEVQLLTGMRSDNLCAMQPRTMDRTDKIWLFRPTTHKTAWRKRPLVIPLGPRCQEILRPFLSGPADAYCFDPQKAPGGKRGRRSRYDSRTYRNAIIRGIKRANRARKARGDPPIPHWSPLQLRHTVATKIRARYGLEASQVYLGHARADVTQIYAERDLAAALRIAFEMG
jgi:integrase